MSIRVINATNILCLSPCDVDRLIGTVSVAYNIPRMVSVFSLEPDEPVSIRSSAFAKASGKVVVPVVFQFLALYRDQP